VFFPIKRVYIRIHSVETDIDSWTSSLGDEIDTISAVFSQMERDNISRYRFTSQLSRFEKFCLITFLLARKITYIVKCAQLAMINASLRAEKSSREMKKYSRDSDICQRLDR